MRNATFQDRNMPLGAIHLIVTEESSEEAGFYCGIADAIAAIRPERLPDFPDDAICPDCLRAHRESQGAAGNVK